MDSGFYALTMLEREKPSLIIATEDIEDLEIHDLLENITQWSEELQRLSPEKMATLMKLGSGVGKVLDMKDKLLKSS